VNSVEARRFDSLFRPNNMSWRYNSESHEGAQSGISFATARREQDSPVMSSYESGRARSLAK